MSPFLEITFCHCYLSLRKRAKICGFIKKKGFHPKSLSLCPGSALRSCFVLGHFDLFKPHFPRVKRKPWNVQPIAKAKAAAPPSHSADGGRWLHAGRPAGLEETVSRKVVNCSRHIVHHSETCTGLSHSQKGKAVKQSWFFEKIQPR